MKFYLTGTLQTRKKSQSERIQTDFLTLKLFHFL